MSRLFCASVFWMAATCICMGTLTAAAGRCKPLTWNMYLELVTSYPAYLFHVGIYLLVFFGSIIIFREMK